MKLSTILEQLNYGEYSTVFEGDKQTGELAPEARREVINFINLGLEDMFIRFDLNRKVLILSLTTGKNTYELIGSNAESQGGTEILDSDDPYLDDLMTIILVNDEEGCELPLNNRNSDDSLFTPSPKVIQVPNPETGTSLFIEYKATIPKLDTSSSDDLDVPIPEYLLKAMLYFIASRKFHNVQRLNGSRKGVDYFAMYETEVQKIGAYGLVQGADDFTDMGVTAGW